MACLIILIRTRRALCPATTAHCCCRKDVAQICARSVWSARSLLPLSNVAKRVECPRVAGNPVAAGSGSKLRALQTLRAVPVTLRLLRLPVAFDHPLAEHFVGRLHRVGLEHEFLL